MKPVLIYVTTSDDKKILVNFLSVTYVRQSSSQGSESIIGFGRDERLYVQETQKEIEDLVKTAVG